MKHYIAILLAAGFAVSTSAIAQDLTAAAPTPVTQSNGAQELLTTSVLPVAAAPARVTAAHTLRAGTILHASDLIVEGGANSDAPSPLEMFVGMETKRSIYAGKALSLNDVGPPTVVSRNAIVMVEFARGPLMITTEGRALDNGAVGDSVRIMNLSSKIILTATVTGPNKAVTR